MTDAPPDILVLVEAAYRQHFEVLPARASVSFLGVDPIEVLRYPDGTTDHYLTLGMARHPMADPAEAVIATASAPRAELLLSAAGRPDRLWRALAVLAAAPAVEGAVYQPGNRVDLGEPLCPGSRCTGGVLVASELQPVAVRGVADVQVLRVLPATQTELAWARVHGSEQLHRRWQVAETDLTDLMRDPVDLS
ncbi:suppressor of fused domain protein [Jatrophihabitans sp.]|uniref:suppressor of fused domain protein n=1 Tax=Jatrophihabitans sp. TaxID=1932789 RepID=UPI002B605261|nr:suppressor of fused domain protein [Jatrophihabitans sp.]